MKSTRTWSLGPLTLRINWLILACVLFAVFGLVRLGLWQLGRAGEKIDAQQAFELQQLENPTPLGQVDPALSDPGELQNLHVALQGEYLNDRTILVLAQFLDDQIGYEVVTPFREQASGQLVLVSRGWTSGILPPNTPPQLLPVDGPLSLTAQIHVPAPDERVLVNQVIDATSWPLRVRSLDISALSTILGADLFPYVVRLTENQPGMLARHWMESNADIDTHLSYALQWFTFAVMIAVGALFASSNLMALMRDPEARKFSSGTPD